MKEMTPVDIAWLVGMIEGEASFSSTTAGKAAKAGYRYPRIEIKSVDLEVLERIQEITGIGTIAFENRSKKNLKHQPCWLWRVTNSRDVLDVLCLVASYGFLSNHRKTQVLGATELCSAILARKKSGESYRRYK